MTADATINKKPIWTGDKLEKLRDLLVGDGDPRFDADADGGEGLSFWITEIGSFAVPLLEEDSALGGEIASVSFSGGGDVILVSGITGRKTEIGSGGDLISFEVVSVSDISGCKTEIGSGGDLISFEVVSVSDISGCKTEIGSGGGDLISLTGEAVDSGVFGAAGETIIGVDGADRGDGGGDFSVKGETD
jgi:hypothetical protein